MNRAATLEILTRGLQNWFTRGLVCLALVAPFAVQAQAPQFMPADIPLDTGLIYKELQPEPGYAGITRSIVEQMRRNHYSTINFDDNFSATLLDSYIKMLDGSRSLFTRADIDAFQQYRRTLDDMLLKGDTNAGYELFNLYQRRLEERLVHTLTLVEDETYEFDFTVDESIELDRSEVPWPASEDELRDLWRKQLKSSVLSLKLTDKEMPDIRETLSKRYRSQLSQILKTNSLDIFQRYMDAMTMAFDPHTQYYAPRAAENFNMNMRLSLEGIGAVLQVEDEYTKVVSIVTGGPADLGGELHPSDRIVSVAQGDDPFVDVIGWRVDDVVQLIRGEKGTVVKLNVKPAGSELETKTVSITRDTVKLEDSSAKSEIVEVDYKGETRKIGVITLPTFYIDFEALQRRDPNYRSSTRDIRDLLIELKKEDISGVVIDLRRNGGGSLSEANSLAGLFIRRGATVQVRDADGNNMVQGDNDEEVVYDGPLAVLVNRLSASASEIFAGAIQDYQRGVVVGGQTFGKGTVQELIPMNDGQIKITRAKFYRISGASTQHRGITPDIVFPDIYDMAEDIGESALPNALQWDTIEPTFYRPWGNLRQYLPALQDRHEARSTINPDFNYVRAQIDRAVENRERNLLSLQEEKLLAERKADDEWLLQTENARRVAKGLEPFADIDALEDDAGGEDEELAMLRDSVGATRVERDDSIESEIDDTTDGSADALADEAVEEEEEDEPDPYLVESGRILLDLRELQQTDPLTLAIRRDE